MMKYHVEHVKVVTMPAGFIRPDDPEESVMAWEVKDENGVRVSVPCAREEDALAICRNLNGDDTALLKHLAKRSW